MAECRAINVDGIVQGVGFRPFVYLFEVSEGACPDNHLTVFIIDSRPVVRAILDEIGQGCDRPRIARRFHWTIVEMIDVVCGRIRGAERPAAGRSQRRDLHERPADRGGHAALVAQWFRRLSPSLLLQARRT